MGDLRVNRRQVVFGLSAVGAGLLVLRLLGAQWPKYPLTFPDSYSFLKVANRGPFHVKFWFDERPIAYPLFLWSVGRSLTVAVLVQTVAYIAAFGALCWTAVKVLHSRPAAAVAVIGVAAIAVQDRYALWTTQILSESLSLALAVASITAWWRAAAAPTVRSLRWAIAWTVAWMLIRDVNVVPALAVAGPVMLVVALSRRPAPAVSATLMSGIALFIAITGYVYASEGATSRNQYPMDNNVGMRILPNPDLTAWFKAGGMPLDDALRGRTGKNSWDDSEAFLRDPTLERYRRWASTRGRIRLTESMVVKFGYWRGRLAGELPNILRTNAVADYDTFGSRHRLPGRVAFLGTPSSKPQLWTFGGLALIGLGLAAADRGRRRLALFGAVGLASAVIDLWFSYVGDPMEVNRHLVGSLARLSVMLVICVALGIDALVPRRGGPVLE